eukprot:CAMPEP_0194712436 /NCGR_PEP_ID=MMETSP0296-20130528/4516_1 /TAXON_ID=39354 /ORGANISM="Heterosigma akashiwo, Strain CCMP2393" /LENGTH=289 /DNA_ID=CAMNT_0039610815 /DNA_START=155 /DNA_END=1021 /DNA_ORIENTATION=+
MSEEYDPFASVGDGSSWAKAGEKQASTGTKGGPSWLGGPTKDESSQKNNVVSTQEESKPQMATSSAGQQEDSGAKGRKRKSRWGVPAEVPTAEKSDNEKKIETVTDKPANDEDGDTDKPANDEDGDSDGDMDMEIEEDSNEDANGDGLQPTDLEGKNGEEEKPATDPRPKKTDEEEKQKTSPDASGKRKRPSKFSSEPLAGSPAPSPPAPQPKQEQPQQSPQAPRPALAGVGMGNGLIPAPQFHPPRGGAPQPAMMHFIPAPLQQQQLPPGPRAPYPVGGGFPMRGGPP